MCSQEKLIVVAGVDFSSRIISNPNCTLVEFYPVVNIFEWPTSCCWSLKLKWFVLKFYSLYFYFGCRQALPDAYYVQELLVLTDSYNEIEFTVKSLLVNFGLNLAFGLFVQLVGCAARNGGAKKEKRERHFRTAPQLTERLIKATLHQNRQWTDDEYQAYLRPRVWSRRISNKLPRGRNIVFQAFISFDFSFMSNGDGKEWKSWSTVQIFSFPWPYLPAFRARSQVLLVTTPLFLVLCQEAVTWNRLRIRKLYLLEFLLYKLWSFKKLL